MSSSSPISSIQKKKTTNSCWNNESCWEDDSMIDAIACGNMHIHFTEKDKIPQELVSFFQNIKKYMHVFLQKLVFDNLNILVNTRNFQSIWDSVLESHMMHHQIMHHVMKQKSTKRNNIVNLVEKCYSSSKKQNLKKSTRDTRGTRRIRLILQSESKKEKEQKDTAYLITKDIRAVNSFIYLSQLNYQILFYYVGGFEELFKTRIEWNNVSLKNWTMFYYEQDKNPKYFEKVDSIKDMLSFLGGRWLEKYYDLKVDENLYEILRQVKFLNDFCFDLVSKFPDPFVITKFDWMSIINILENLENCFLYFQERVNHWFFSFFDIVKPYWKVNQKKLFKPFDILEDKRGKKSLSLFYDQSETIQNLKDDFFHLAMDL